MSTANQNSNIYKLGNFPINRLGYGGMQLTGKGVWGDAPDRDNAMKVLQKAVASGVNFIDTADSYGPHTNETLIADALYPYPNELLIATKAGFDRTGPNQWRVNGDPNHIRESIEGSLKRLKKEVIDLWQLHRIDPRFPVEETLGPVADAVTAGKIRYVGLSEVDVEEIKRAQQTIPIVSVQNLYNLGNRQWENVLDFTTQEGMAFIPWYPLASGPDKLKSKISAIAEKHEATTAQIALAWLLRRSENILLIPGTSSITHLEENMASANIQLSDDDFAALS
jgi:pyridoxine 4-dehydrogenase